MKASARFWRLWCVPTRCRPRRSVRVIDEWEASSFAPSWVDAEGRAQLAVAARVVRDHRECRRCGRPTRS